MDQKHHGNLLVALQFVALTVLVINAGPAARFWPSAVGLAASAGLMLWAVVSMGRVTFRFHPQPLDEGKLTTRGVYRWIRHPMYTAALLGSLVSTWMQPTLLAAVSLVIVAWVLHQKMQWEEAALRRKFPEYQSYAKKVPALVPFLPKSPRLRRAGNRVIVACLLLPSVWLPIEAIWDAHLFPAAGEEPASSLSQNLTVAEARALLSSQSDLTLIDVRSSYETLGRYLSGTKQVQSSARDLKVATEHLDKKDPLLVYCSGGFRSRYAVGKLRELGFEEIYHLNRGILGWALCGEDLEKR